MSERDHLRLVGDDEAQDLLADLRARVGELGGFIAFRRETDPDGFVPVAGTLELTTEGGESVWCLSLEPDVQFLVREDDIVRVMAAHHLERLERDDRGDTDSEESS